MVGFRKALAQALGVCALITLTALTACSSNPPPDVSITRAIQGMADDLGKYHSINLMEVSRWSQSQQLQFTGAVWTEQCRQKASDPVIVMLRDSVLLKLTGAFTGTGDFSVGTAGTGLPSLGASGSSSKTAAQELDVPIYMVNLTELSDYTYLQMKERFQSVWTEQSPSGLTYGAQLEESHLRLNAIVTELVADFIPDNCPKGHKAYGANPSVFYGTKAQPK